MSTENPQPVSRKMIAKKSKNLEPPSLVCQNNVMKRKLACNVDSLLLCWYFIMSSPEPQPIEKLMMKLTIKS
jgi:hypothetical protein